MAFVPKQLPSGADLGHYAVLRVRVRDFLHFTFLYTEARQGIDLIQNWPNHGPLQVADSLRTASLGWLASLIDPVSPAINAFEIWKRVFPEHKDHIRAAEAKMKPHMTALMRFRNEVAFHGDRNPQKHVEANRDINTPEFIAAMDSFFVLSALIVQEEEKWSELTAAVNAIPLSIQ